MKKILIITSLYYLNTLFCSTAQELELMHVIFSQADRYPDRDEKLMAGSDSYDYITANGDYGLLTQAGKLRQYNLGKMARQMYDQFLGEYKHQEVYARNTVVERSKQSLLSFLAGLYPVSHNPAFTDEINWAPIPTNMQPLNNDFLLVTRNPACGIPRLTIPGIAERMQPYRGFYEELRTKTNITDFAPRFFSVLYHYVESHLFMGLPLPNWCTQEDWQKLIEITQIHYESMGATAARRKAIAGPIIDEVLRNIQDNEVKKRKIYIYSAHPVNIASLIQAHNETGIRSIPEYGSLMFIDILKTFYNQRYIRMVYWSGVSAQLLPIHIPNCDQTCLLDRYKEIMRPIIPNEEEKICYTRSCT